MVRFPVKPYYIPDVNSFRIVANLPAEIAHLLEEIHAKDQVVQECRNTIAARDNSIQKFVKLNGTGLPNPKEEGYCKLVKDNFERAKALQEEKCTLAEKQALLVSLPSSPSPQNPPLTKYAKTSSTAKSNAWTLKSAISKTMAP